MSDNKEKVKLIIEIPKEYYDDMKVSNCWWSGLKKCVMNGIPLDTVKAEIRNLSFDVTEKSSGEQITLNYTVNVLDILDNIGKEK